MLRCAAAEYNCIDRGYHQMFTSNDYTQLCMRTGVFGKVKTPVLITTAVEHIRICQYELSNALGRFCQRRCPR